MNKHKDFSLDKASHDLRELLNQILVIINNKDKNPNKITYNGPEILSSSVLCCSPNISESFQQDSIDYNSERGRDLIDLFIMKVFQLGYSVGTEHERVNTVLMQEILDAILKSRQTKF